MLACSLLGSGEVVCPGEYGGHLQGLATEPGKAIYWSFTVALVKTDEQGRVLVSVDAPSHQGDLEWRRGRLYVAVNLGQFNEEAGKADSWVYVYDDDTLALIERYRVPEVVHGAGGMAWHDGHFFIVGGLPKTHTENYVYEYNRRFRFVKRHAIPSGYTELGIQTICRGDDGWWFGCYGAPRVLLRTGDTFSSVKAYELDYSYGIARWTDGSYLRGLSLHAPNSKTWSGGAHVSNMPEEITKAKQLSIPAPPGQQRQQ
jgi:hypothetical protein